MSAKRENSEVPFDRKAKSGEFAKMMKWVGYATAILSLAGAIGGIGKTLWDRAETHRKAISTRVETHSELDNALAAAQLEAGARDYLSAWKSLDDASKIDPSSDRVHTAQEDLAMKWLDDEIDPGPNGKFLTITEKLKPVLVRGVTASKPGPRQADLLAHIGWCYFLEYRDQALDSNPAAAAEYAKAVEEDPNNPYAQAMWGHWLLWGQEDVPGAEKHFAAALASHRETNYVRGMQLSALLNHSNREVDMEVVRVANAMRKERQTINADETHQIFEMYYSEIDPWTAVPVKFANAVPPEEHLETFHWLFDKVQLDGSKSVGRSYYLAVLEEVAGRRDQALATYRGLQSEVAEGNSIRNAADAGIKRLSKNSK
jgi:tetratricopeptide (TPR) repeat protein